MRIRRKSCSNLTRSSARRGHVRAFSRSEGRRETMDRVIVSGIPPFDGEFELDLSTRVFSTLEWRWIKKISGYLPLTIQQGLEGGDPDIFVVMAVIALYRAGKIQREQAYMAADALAEPPCDGSAIQIFVGESEQPGDVRPPASSPTTNGAQ